MANSSGVQTKRSVVVHKKDNRVENLYQLIAQVEEHVAELTRMYSELPDSKHKSVGGMMKPTLKQEIIAEQIKKAEVRLNKLIRLLEQEY